MPNPQPRRLTDPRELRALAHPVRVSIIEQLVISGPLTATELAERLDETPANCSWHLRKLAQFGFVEEAAGGKGRQRPWQVPALGFSWDEDPTSATAEELHAVRALTEVVLERATNRLREAEERMADEPEEWRKAQDRSQTLAWLTAREMREMNDAIGALMREHIDRFSDPSTRPEGARLCEFVAWGVPTYFPGVEES
jgi:DNA-binding transcriptional ArsR family regulator